MKILLLGPYGQVGWELQRALAPLGHIVTGDRHGSANCVVDLEQRDSLRSAILQVRPDVIVNAAAYTAVDQAQTEHARARQINALAPGVLAEEAARLSALLVHYSTDYVFDGSGNQPWQEGDPVAPLNVYGQTKLEGEELIRQSGARHLLFRTSWVYAARGRNFLRTILRLGQERNRLQVVDDQHGAPTGAELIADVTAHAIRTAGTRTDVSGTMHLCANGATTWYGYARHVVSNARRLGVAMRLDLEGLHPCRTDEFPTPARRPHNSRMSTLRLCSQLGLEMPDWTVGVDRVLEEICVL